jgi:hypothetical protein
MGLAEKYIALQYPTVWCAVHMGLCIAGLPSNGWYVDFDRTVS